MSYQVLARKCRPKRFSEVVGQQHITRTLQNAIGQDRVGHAYLFVGPRGTGKTTTARIFAKALNCTQLRDNEPCCECDNCREIAEGSCLDVIEMDGASHNRVEHIRDIRDNVQYTPARGRYKIYIIDEVHMLTPSAWNALLKTLEEPPPHVKFLFATTEPHKVLATIVSRCQRFDLKAIPVPLIVDRLGQIAVQEGVAVEDGALNAIARAADGGMRDAQSIFDQMIAFCGGLAEGEIIREADVIDVFGLASGMELRTLAVSLLENDLDAAIGVIQDLADHGRDLERVYADLVSFIRNIMVCTVCRDPGRILEVTESELQDCLGIGAAVDHGLVQRLLQGLVAEEWSFRSALNKRVYLEATLARVNLEAHSIQLNDIIAQLTAMRDGGQSADIPLPTRPEKPRIPPPPDSLRTPHVVRGTPDQAPTPVPVPPPSPPVAAVLAPPVAAAPAPPVAAAPPPAPVPVPPPAPPVAETPAPPVAAAPPPAPVPVPPPAPPVAAVPAPPVAAAPAPPVAETPAPPVAATPAPAPVPVPPPAAPAEMRASPAPADTSPGQQRATLHPPPPAPPSPLGGGAEDGDTPAEGADDGPPWGDDSEDVDRALDSVNVGTWDELPEWHADTSQDNMEGGQETSSAQVDLAALFAEILEQLDGHPAGANLLPLIRQLRPVSLIGNVLQLAYDPDDMPVHDISRMLQPETLDVVQECFALVAPHPESRVVIKRWLVSVSDSQRQQRRRATQEEIERVAEHPFVRLVCERVGGSVVDARIASR